MGLEGMIGGGDIDGNGNGNNSNDNSDRGNEVNVNKTIASPTMDQFALGLVEQNIEELFTDQFDDPYAAVRVDKHFETLRIKSSRFTNWIANYITQIQKMCLVLIT